MAIDEDERPLGEVKVRAGIRQVERLLDCAAPFEKRIWAIEGRVAWWLPVGQREAGARDGPTRSRP